MFLDTDVRSKPSNKYFDAKKLVIGRKMIKAQYQRTVKKLPASILLCDCPPS